jgi:hypothetical protein
MNDNWLHSAWNQVKTSSPIIIKERGEGYLMGVFDLIAEHLVTAYSTRVQVVLRSDQDEFRREVADPLLKTALKRTRRKKR